MRADDTTPTWSETVGVLITNDIATEYFYNIFGVVVALAEPKLITPPWLWNFAVRG